MAVHRDHPNVIELEEASNFLELVSKGVSLIDFHAVWCAPCKMLGPILMNLMKSHPRSRMIKVDVDDFSEIAKINKVEKMPTVMFYKDGRVMEKFFVGASKPIVTAIEEYLTELEKDNDNDE